MPEIRKLDYSFAEQITELYADIFTKEPWNDDWSNKAQLDAYIADLTGNRNSLTFGLYEDDELIGLSMGSIRHWYTGTEYYIDEFCIKTEKQGGRRGTWFLCAVEEYIKTMGITHIFLQTNRNVPAYNFYRKNGFTQLEDHVSFVKDLK